MKSIARLISGIFHPYLIPFYGSIIFTAYSYLVGLPLILNIYIIGGILLFSGIFPTLFHAIYYLFFRNKENVWAVVPRYEKFIYCIFLALCSIYLWRMNMPVWGKSFIIGSTMTAFVVWISDLTHRPISAHMAALGTLWGLIYIIPGPLTLIPLDLIIVLILATGATSTARQLLQKENILQTVIGLVGGFITQPIVYQLLISLTQTI